jgi:hypothetical protein
LKRPTAAICRIDANECEALIGGMDNTPPWMNDGRFGFGYPYCPCYPNPYYPRYPGNTPPINPRPVGGEPALVPNNSPTRALSPDDFPGNVSTPTTPPQPPAIVTDTAPSDDSRVSSVLAGLKAARARLDDKDPATAQAAWRQVALHVGYLTGWLEARGTTLPLNGMFPGASDMTPREAVDALIKVLEGGVTATRCLPIFLAGMFVGVLLSRAL